MHRLMSPKIQSIMSPKIQSNIRSKFINVELEAVVPWHQDEDAPVLTEALKVVPNDEEHYEQLREMAWEAFNSNGGSHTAWRIGLNPGMLNDQNFSVDTNVMEGVYTGSLEGADISTVDPYEYNICTDCMNFSENCDCFDDEYEDDEESEPESEPEDEDEEPDLPGMDMEPGWGV